MNRNVTRFLMADRRDLLAASEALGAQADLAFSADHEGFTVVVSPEDGIRAQSAIEAAGLVPTRFEPFVEATDEEEDIFRSIERLPSEYLEDGIDPDATYVPAWNAWV